MKKTILLLSVIIAVLLQACKKDDIDKTSVFEGTYTAPVAYNQYNKVVITRVGNTSFTIQYALNNAAPFLIIPTATLENDSAFSFNLAASVNNSTGKYSVKGDGYIFPNRIVINGKAVNDTNTLDFYQLSFEGYR